MIKPYYEHAGITIHHGDCLEIMPELDKVDLIFTDTPYGIRYNSNMCEWRGFARNIKGDKDTSLRDNILNYYKNKPAIIFGTWKQPKPLNIKMLLIWDTKGALGMGDLSLPWKPSHQEIYILGNGYIGKRTTDVLRFAPVQSLSKNGRTHPHEKPIALIRDLFSKCPAEWIALDPCIGTGAILVTAKLLNRKAIGIEIEEKYCEIAAKRLQQEVFQFNTH